MPDTTPEAFASALSALSAMLLRRLSTAAAGKVGAAVVGAQSCPRVAGPPPNLPAVVERLNQLQARFPRAIIERYRDRVPEVHDSALVCAGSVLVGDVKLAANVSIWHTAVLRGDLNYIEVGENSNVQDGAVVHLGDNDPTIIMEDVVVGHRAMLHGCTIEGGVLIGMQATVLDGAVVGHGSIVGAGAVVSAGTKIPPHSLVLGLPGKVVKTLDPGKEAFNRALAEKYCRLAFNHLNG